MDPFNLAKIYEALDEVKGSATRMSKEVYAEGTAKIDKCLVGIILGNKTINKEGFLLNFKKAFHIAHEVEIELVGRDNTFAFYFKMEADRERVFLGSPWIFDKQLVVLCKPIRVGDLADLKFSHADLWLQLHNVPLARMTERAARFLGNLFGKACEIDLGGSDYAGKLARHIELTASKIGGFLTIPFKVVSQQWTVDQLITQECSWRLDVIDKLFVPIDAQAIQSIALAQYANEDEICWFLEKTRDYSVCSGYRLLVSEKHQVCSFADEDFTAKRAEIAAIKEVLQFSWNGDLRWLGLVITN
ncbi:hypothetical protein Syun_023301 [Stephania yunnanensis]|uniref:DUF4283 domain-containing protein n=1 Tax=Stephania yunnanensis TaxID=152371 RepID=A0AAP0F8P7_9MAGN